MSEYDQDRIRQELESCAEPEYRKFSSHLLPEGEQLLGVRLPKLRQMAKEIAKGDFRDYLATARDEVFEETMLQGMVIGYAKCPLEERLQLITAFLPKIRNWSVCDSFVVGLKFTKKNKERVFSYLLPLFQSKKEYTVRFACVMLLNYYTDDEDLVRDLAVLESLSDQPFYAKMAVAWALSILYLHHRPEVCEFLKKTTLDDSTVNLAVRKILESRLVKGEERDTVRALKR